MPIVTLCKSCNTIHRDIIDRCKYCGSQHVSVKFINESMIKHKDNRDFIKDENGHGNKAHS